MKKVNVYTLIANQLREVLLYCFTNNPLILMIVILGKVIGTRSKVVSLSLSIYLYLCLSLIYRFLKIFVFHYPLY